MKLYYHKTDGGAEYYCLDHVAGSEEGMMNTAVLRTDGDEIEIFTTNTNKNRIKIVIN